MAENKSLNYLEYPSRDLQASKTFFSTVFSWAFTDYGPNYTAFTTANMEGGFYQSDKISQVNQGAALTVFYSTDLNSIKQEINHAGGTITLEIFAFPGGHRFHFCEPGGSEFAVWSDKYESP